MLAAHLFVAIAANPCQKTSKAKRRQAKRGHPTERDARDIPCKRASIRFEVRGDFGRRFVSQEILRRMFGERQMGGGGAKRIVRLLGGKRTIGCPLGNRFWRPQKVGFVWSVPVPLRKMTGRWQTGLENVS